MPVKECFGHLANINIRYIDQSKKHFMRVDEEKLKECDMCPLFAKCMFLRYNEIIKDLIRMVDEGPTARPKL